MKWKKIPDINYEVSTCGNVRHIERRKILKPYITKLGYGTISVCFNGKNKHYLIHRLVAKAFIEGESKSRCEVNHKDGNKLNNDIKNLEWVTKSENQQHSTMMGFAVVPKGHSLNAKKVREIKKLLAKGWFQKDIAKKIGTSQGNVSQVKLRKIWKWVD